jgi:hypothetical protein
MAATASTSIDVLLSILNAAEVGTLESIADKMRQVREGLVQRGEADLASRADEAVEALRRGDVAEWKRARAFLQSRIGHLR